MTVKVKYALMNDCVCAYRYTKYVEADGKEEAVKAIKANHKEDLKHFGFKLVEVCEA